MTVGGQTSTTQSLYVGSASYVAVPPSSRSETGGRPWIEYAGLSPVQQTTYPTDPLLLLLAEPTNVHLLGSAVIDGTSTTDYSAAISLTPSLGYSPLLDAIVQEFRSEMGASSAAVEIWVDGHDVAHQMSYDIEGSIGREKSTLQLSGFGTNVNLAAPPASQVFQMSAASVGS